MTLYAAAPARAARQIIGDLLFLGWIWMWAWAGERAHGLVWDLGAPGRATMDSADDIAGQLRDIEGRIVDVPLVGDELGDPFSQLAGQADTLGAAGESMARTVDQLALAVGLAVVLIPVLLVAVVYLPVRIRFVRQASMARRAAGGDPALFALRALANQPVRKLTEITDDPVAAWRDGDEPTIRRLADLELRSLGVRR